MFKLLKIILGMIAIYLVVVTSVIFAIDRVGDDGDSKTVSECFGKAVSFTYNEFDKSFSKNDIDLDSTINNIDKAIDSVELGNRSDYDKGREDGKKEYNK